MIKTLASVLSAVIFASWAALAIAAPPSAYDMMKPSSYANVELSPSGQYLAFTIKKTGMHCLDRAGGIVALDKAKCKEKNKVLRTQHFVSVYDLEALEPIRTTSVPENFYVNWLEWASDERLLLAIRRPVTVGSNYRYVTFGGSRIISIDIHSGKNIAFFQDEEKISRENRNLTRISNLLRGDPDHVMMPAYRNQDLDLWKVNVLTGSAQRVAAGRSGTFYWYTTSKGIPVMRFDCKNSRCRRIDVYTPEGQLSISEDTDMDVDEDTKWKKIKSFEISPDEDEDDFDFWPVAPGEKENQFYVMSNEESDPRRSIKLYDLETETYVKTVFEHPTHDVGGAVLNLQTGEYAGAWYYEDRLNFTLLDDTAQIHYDALNTYFDNKQNISLLGFNAKGTQAIVYAKGTDNPGSYHIYDFNKKHVEQIFMRKTELGYRLGTETDILKIPARDGTLITAYHTKPEASTGSHVPLIVMPHGGPESRDYYNYDSWVQYYATRGYQVLQINFRGSSGYGRDFAEAGYGEWGGLMQDDITDTVKHLYAKNLASADNACIFGYSYGGYAALYGGATTPELYKCVVGGGGVSDMMLYLKQAKKQYGKKSEAYEYWVKSMGDPKIDKEKLIAASPINFVQNFDDPVLLIHGEYDSIVDMSHSKLMADALEKAGKPVTFIELEDEGHNRWDLDKDVLYLETIERFLAEHLTGGSPLPSEE